MACTLSASGLLPLKQRVVSRSSLRRNSVCVKDKKGGDNRIFFQEGRCGYLGLLPKRRNNLSRKKASNCLNPSPRRRLLRCLSPPRPREAFASANESISDVALANVNILGVIAVALFIIIPVSFLVILYVKSTAEGNVSGGFSQSYYDESKKMGKKLTNEAAVLKGKGTGMRPEK
ncbi:unnamed protein product [Bathycoccus prasinos]